MPAGTFACVPPLVVHGFRNGADAELRYLNFHAPGHGFADYMRGLRDGRAVAFDQAEPPQDGGRPATEAAVGGDVDGEEIGIAVASSEPGSASTAHVHGRHLESFYVLAGEIALTTGGRELRAPAGSWVQVPAGVPHALSCPGPEPARVLTVRSPLGRRPSGYMKR